MDPIFIATNNVVLWTVSVENSNTYCLYVCGQLYRRNLSVKDLIDEYHAAVEQFTV